ncbi:insulinase family protein [Affinibrenneria salicis]|uniref:Insulinase family protein n=1 Tax=Affinibrenneria salicis TaxID=2590031 RepID=A0A5J5G5P0_9GAMM|nr:M16 family metallopeptidase [Affinibrenneria salicis]KAA9002529.1 insulinase family protein [Affinibrenneria salicis]KAA9003183.1 insulinase family protein [Affinibrenneria salicis]
MNWKKFYWLAFAVGLFTLSAGSLAADAGAVQSPLPHIKEGRLANGLQYTLVPLAGQQNRIDIRLSVDVGSIDEQDNESGAAHMVEHMVFHTSDAFDQGVSQALNQQGWVRAQHYNAMTNYERTQYMMSPPAGKRELGLALQALSQMAGHARFLPRDLDNERQIILEEWRGKLGVAERMNQQRVQAIRHDSRYPLRPVIGTEQAINDTPASLLRAFYQRWYRPSNMRLLLIGDIPLAEAEREIRRYFADLPAGNVPVRDYYEPRLAPQLDVVRLQDSQSGTSQVSVVYRFQDEGVGGRAGMRYRLLNQITLSALSRQMRRQKSELPPEVSSLVVRKSDIGRTTVALGFFADVMPGGHHASLAVLLGEIERIRRYSLSERDIVDVKSDIREVALGMVSQPEQRDFADWVQQITVPWLQGRAYVGSQTRGRQVLDELAGITQQDVNQHLQRWLAETDRLVQFSVPGSAPFTLPTSEAVQQQQTQWTTAALTPPRLPEAKLIPELPSVTQRGERTALKHFPAQHVEQWQLSNGDRVVWLRTPQAGQTVYFTAESPAGYMAAGLNPWQVQLARQLVAQSGPADWRGEDLSGWKQARSLSLNIDQTAEQLQFSGQAPVAQLTSLFGLYSALHSAPGIDPEVMKESMTRLIRQQINSQQSVADLRGREITALRFGRPAYPQAQLTQLKQVAAPELLAQWRKAASAPATYYLLADMPAEQLLPLVERYLASIPRRTIGDATPYLAQTGRREAVSAISIEPRADIRAWSFTPWRWTPHSAVQVSVAASLANKYLKNSLRDDELGIYRMQVNSLLDTSKQRIETEVTFTSAPHRAQALWQRAEQIFTSLPQQITGQDIEGQKQQFIRAEQRRRQDILTQQHRLMLSYQQYGDPRYLSEQAHLAEAITLEGVRAMAARLFNPDNRVLYITLPQEAQL